MHRRTEHANLYLPTHARTHAVNGKNFIFDGGTVSFCGGGAGIWIFDTANGATIGNTSAPAENRVYVISNTGVGIAVDSPGVTVTNAAIGKFSVCTMLVAALV